MKSPAFVARNASVVLAPFPVTRGDFAFLIRKDNVMLGSLAVDQRELNDLSFGC